MVISAKLVAEGVGLPAWWVDDEGAVIAQSWQALPDVLPHLRPFDLSDPQTAFGVALKLDEWERARGNIGAAWTQQLAQVAHREPYEVGGGEVSDQRGDAIQALIARLTHIGQDHAIRRALGWTVERGSLAALTGGEGHWLFRPSAKESRYFCGRGCGHPYIPALFDITDPTQALAAIYKEMSTCG